NVYGTANGTPFATDSSGAAIPLDAKGNPTTPYTTITFPPTGGSPTSPTAPITMNVPASTSPSGVTTLPIPNIQFNL
ncbi:hypothetical protein ABTK39_20170, partial [Acinetobacter baumannii]